MNCDGSRELRLLFLPFASSKLVRGAKLVLPFRSHPDSSMQFKPSTQASKHAKTKQKLRCRCKAGASKVVVAAKLAPRVHLLFGNASTRCGTDLSGHTRVRPLTTTMASLAARSLPLARTHSARAAPRRLLSTTRVVRQEATPNLGSVPPAKKPVGAFRGGCVPVLARLS